MASSATPASIRVASIAIALAAFAEAATIQVPNAGAGIVTLQDGLDAAQAGDTVLIAPGRYSGSFSVANKNGITLRGQGAGKVVIEARDGTMGEVGIGLKLTDCDSARLENLVVERALATMSAKGAGIVFVSSNSVTLKNVAVYECAEEGIEIDGNQATLTDCSVRSCGGGIKIMGDGATLKNCAVNADSIRGIGLFGNSCAVSECVVGGILSGSGISIAGEAPTVVKNRVTGIHDLLFSGISTTGSSPRIEKNIVSGAPVGIFIVYGGFGTIAKNDIFDCYDSGLVVAEVSHDLLIKENTVTRCGSLTTAGYKIAGDSETLRKNKAIDCASDGFQFLSPGVVAEENLAENCAKDGFDIDANATAATLTKNTARGNRGEGIENSAASVTLTKNSAKLNRIDFANDGSVTTSSGNDFTVAGAPAPEID